MKKKLLFILPSLESGGAEKGLITLLSLLDYSRYEAELFLFRREGFFLNTVPDEVAVTDAGEDYRVFDGSLFKATRRFLFEGKLSLALTRWRYAFALRRKEGLKKRKLLWDLLQRVLPAQEQTYDVAVGYLEGNTTYYCAYCVNAHKKMAVLHSDYEKLAPNPAFDLRAYERMDTVITVSDACKEVLLKAIPALASKTTVIENIVRKDAIERMAKEPYTFDADADETVVLTIARLSAEKGVDLALETCEALLREGIRVKWFMIGDGPDKAVLPARIRERGLENAFVLLGRTHNPYKYLAHCDVYVQPSRYEGKSIALEEAKLLAKPIVATAFSTVRDQLEDGVTGLITDADPVALAACVRRLITDAQLRHRLTEHLAAVSSGNENEVEKFFALLDTSATQP